MRIRKAVFPVAGLGTRFLPATKASAKEMLPVVDKPLVQYAVKEAIAAGAEEMVFITVHAKNSTMDHFDRDYEWEAALADRARKSCWQPFTTYCLRASAAFISVRLINLGWVMPLIAPYPLWATRILPSFWPMT